MRLAFITSNPGKVEEAKKYFEPLGVEVYQLRMEYPEIQADSLEEVALFGLEWLARKIDGPFFLDDSGLFIDALGGFPGVYSAYVYRTLGIGGILKLMDGLEDRNAHFRSVIAYWDGEAHIFTGRVDGEITTSPRGSGGFGFDPIFRPRGFNITFAEMTTEQKNVISHRGRALKAFADWLKENLK
ncbi:XTP/dITP diphosphatase [Thermococcus thioreducens]|uniref:dITP/XTP pyrophosphatase n=1 Tax=Thermococcus thioreducens TaxID=277988 RepID=A0A0Q2M1A5_9EURY|nr:XTP/dITP diphosphatase [Thermococcus thioreducens]ASJ13461.1 non-canonical purine NTP pyrophosphatase [Thermococcus thioreducens]KQH81650.1 Non-canonical purine NTP pyrophosphatase [Thermococcus thioreducens]SEV96884.1 dITPase [Thermococcus thioreducens]